MPTAEPLLVTLGAAALYQQKLPVKSIANFIYEN